MEILTKTDSLPEIKWNNEELKKELLEKVEYYKGLVYSPEQIKEAKADRAKLRKLAQAIDGKRKEIKNQCLVPYELFESQCKELLQIVERPIAEIDGQVKAYEEKCRQEKEEKVLKIFNETEFPDFITYERIKDDKWMNNSTSLKSIKESMQAMKTEIEQNLAMLSELPEFGFEATELFKNTLNLQSAVNKAKQMSEIQALKRKKEEEQRIAEEQRKAEQEKAKQVEAFTENVNPPVQEPTQQHEVKPETETPETWITFRALLNREKAIALNKFCKENGIVLEKY